MGACALLSMLAGCIVLSVYPFYNAKDLIFDPGLTGNWARGDAASEFWQFSRSGETAYLLATVNSQETNCFEAHLFQLKKFQFLDLLATNRAEFQLPLHLISQVTHNGTNMSLQFLDYGWLTGLLQTNPAVLHHILVPEKAGETNSGDMLYLTASTRDLQIFLLKHATDTNAFNANSAVELKRVGE